MPCFLVLAEKLRRKFKLSVELPDSPEFESWFEKVLLRRLNLSSHQELTEALNRNYRENPYELGILLSELAAEWWASQKSALEARFKARRKPIEAHVTV